MEEFVSITKEVWERVARACRLVELYLLGNASSPSVPRDTLEVYDARVTSTVADSAGHLDAEVTAWDEDAGSWTDYDPIKIRPAYGDILSVRCIGETTLPAGSGSGTAYPLYEAVGVDNVTVQAPSTGIPAAHASAWGSGGAGSGGCSSTIVPGHAYCQVLRNPGPGRSLAPTGESLLVYNFQVGLEVDGCAILTAGRQQDGTFAVGGHGLPTQDCEEGSTGSTGSTGSGGGTGNSTCFDGACGSDGVVSTLTATITDNVGCFTSAPATLTFECKDHTDGSGSHYYWTPTNGTSFCGGTLVFMQDMGTPGNALPGIQGGSFGPVAAEDGWTCSPFSAVFLVDDGAGNSATITVVE